MSVGPIPLDQVALQFDDGRLLALNGILALVMFGVALDMRWADFRRVARDPRPALLGLTAQFVLLPAFTFFLVLLGRPQASIALGMMLVAACPGGSLSNFFTHFARGNAALSVSMSAVSTLVCVVATPFNIAFWGGLYPPTAELLQKVALDPVKLAGTVALVLGLPICLGMTVADRRPAVAERLRRPMKIFSLAVFVLFVVLALAANWQPFLEHIGAVALWVVFHNAVAFALGYGFARGFGLPERDRRAVAIEVGFQNTALGLVLIFDNFGGLGGMALVAAWWGIWHLVAGLVVGGWWARREPVRGSA